METEAEPRFPLHHSNTTYEGIYTLKAPCMRCLTVLENGLFSRSLTNEHVGSTTFGAEGTSKLTD